MKRVEVLVRAFLLAEVTLALRSTPISGATATELWDAGSARAAGRVPIVKVEVVVHDDLVARVVSAIQGATGRFGAGDALVLVEPVVGATGLPRGEVDEAAIA